MQNRMGSIVINGLMDWLHSDDWKNAIPRAGAGWGIEETPFQQYPRSVMVEPQTCFERACYLR